MSASSKLKNILIGQSLQLTRENLKLSRQEVAERLEVLPQFVANWERGQCLPPKRVLPKMKELYSMSNKDLVNLYTRATKVALEEYFENLEDKA